MRISLRTVAATLGLGALAVPALAQFGPGPPPPPQSGPARIWNNAGPKEYVNENPVLSADIGIGDTGNFTGVLDTQANKLCYLLTAPGIDKPTAAHIHKGAAGENGAPVVTLETPADGTSGACVELKADLAKALLASPEGYYVNVHNAAYPAGAARGQLDPWPRAGRGTDG
jgi:hypothetical protein